ncbi:hypothetical protein J6590_078575 [Homalodisca vitripennis]|nr:hypothetical protein J6590_078575 [Homalodisca vitripennis]
MLESFTGSQVLCCQLHNSSDVGDLHIKAETKQKYDEGSGEDTRGLVPYGKQHYTLGSAARDPHGIKQITVGPPHGIKQITMFIRENVECLDSSFTTTTTIKCMRTADSLFSRELVTSSDVKLILKDKCTNVAIDVSSELAFWCEISRTVAVFRSGDRVVVGIQGKVSIIYVD